MKIPFSKYHGAGNDFIMVDGRDKRISGLDTKRIEMLCHRRFGIGADGLIIVYEQAGYDFAMKYFNSDGKEGSMCGNGGRCSVAFARTLGLVSSDKVSFIAVDGQHEASFVENNLVRLKMKDVEEVKETGDYFFVDTGSPHVIIVVDNIEAVDVEGLGSKIRHNKQLFPEGTNVNFISFTEPNILDIRTYERGVEAETWACGTGSVASAVFCAFMNKKTGHQQIRLLAKGGNLEVGFETDGKRFRNIYLSGPVAKAFEGIVQID